MQIFLVLLTVGLATFYLGKSFYKRFISKDKKGTCGSCSIVKQI